MRINGILMEDITRIKDNYDNLKILDIIMYLTNVVINDIEDMNKENIEIAQDYLIDYDLGNGKYIKSQDLESLVSITDTITDIIEYNK